MLRNKNYEKFIKFILKYKTKIIIIFFGSKDIKKRVEKFIREESILFNGKKVIDFPAGSGETTSVLIDVGANVNAYDLFPEFFKVKEINCNYCDLNEDILSIERNSADIVFCQEGIEHISDQLKVFKNFNQILKRNGKIYLTTPNLSNIKSKISFLFHESESFYKIMPVNEIDSIWFGKDEKVYFGHIFLINIYKIRILSLISGFKIKRIISTRVNYTSFLILIFIYPMIIFTSLLGFLRALKKSKYKNINIYKDILFLNLNLNVLLGNHLFLELEKCDINESIKKDFKGKEIIRT